MIFQSLLFALKGIHNAMQSHKIEEDFPQLIGLCYDHEMQPFLYVFYINLSGLCHASCAISEL